MLYAVFVAELAELCPELGSAVCPDCSWLADFDEPIGQLSDDGRCVRTS